MVTTRPPKTIVKPTALGPVANTDTKLLIYGLFQKGRVLAQDGLDFLIPLSVERLRRLLTEWREYYNRARPHSSLGPCLPTPCVELPMKPDQHRHRLPDQGAVASRPVLGGLHHDYRLSRVA